MLLVARLNSLTRSLSYSNCLFSNCLFTVLLFAEFANISIPCQVYAEAKLAAVEQLIDRASERASEVVGVEVVDFDTGEELFGHKAATPLTPASVEKVVTSASALEILGPSAVATTDFFVKGRKGASVQTLYVKGGGDPSLTIESAWLAARRIRASGIDTIGDIVLDATAFVEERNRVGGRAYETGASPLSFNFNSVGFQVCPGSSPGQKASVQIDPWEAHFSLEKEVQTKRGSGLSIGITASKRENKYQISGTIGDDAECVTRYRSVEDPPDYFGRVFKELLTSVGVKVQGTVREGEVSGSANLLFSHESKAVRNLLEDLNHFSNNFIGEQLLYLFGKEGDRYSRERGLQRIRSFLKKVGVPEGEYTVLDGSGLSHENKLSPRAVVQVFRYAAHNPLSGIEFLNSLSVGAESGTLKERDFGDGVVVRGKTGTLNGVSSLAGVVRAKSGRRIAFAIIENSLSSKDKGVTLEDKIVHTLYSVL